MVQVTTRCECLYYFEGDRRTRLALDLFHSSEKNYFRRTTFVSQGCFYCCPFVLRTPSSQTMSEKTARISSHTIDKWSISYWFGCFFVMWVLGVKGGTCQQIIWYSFHDNLVWIDINFWLSIIILGGSVIKNSCLIKKIKFNQIFDRV